MDCSTHIIVTMRAKMKLVQSTKEVGEWWVEKLGQQAAHRDDVEYPFDVVGVWPRIKSWPSPSPAVRCCRAPR